MKYESILLSNALGFAMATSQQPVNAPSSSASEEEIITERRYDEAPRSYRKGHLLGKVCDINTHHSTLVFTFNAFSLIFDPQKNQMRMSWHGSSSVMSNMFSQGGFARVYLLTDVATGEIFAGKIVLKSSLTKSRAKQKVPDECILPNLTLNPNSMNLSTQLLNFDSFAAHD